MKRLLLSVTALAVCASLAIAAAAPQKPVARTSAKTTAAPARMKDSAMQQIDHFIATAKIDKKAPNWKTSLPKPPVATFEAGHTYLARMVTNKGPLLIEFMPKVAPMHVSSFIYLAKLGFFDGLKFHRVIKGFMAQGGDPLGTGGGSPGYRMNGEFSPEVKHDRPGRLSTANAGPGTDGSQFFLTFVPTPWLDGKHTIFGAAEGGEDVLAALEKCGSSTGKTSERLVLEKVTIEIG